MSKKTQERSGASSSEKKWANQVQVFENGDKHGLEMHFNAEPHPELQAKLRAMGFRPGKWRLMWYNEQRPENREFAEQVKLSLPGSFYGPEMNLAPSFSSVRTNIEKKDYSFVIITLKNGETTNYIVFERSKPRAEVIATRFAREKFKDEFLVLAVKPYGQVKEARLLFDEGKIISPLLESPTKEALKGPERISSESENSEEVSMEEVLTAERPVFDAVVMANLIATDQYLSNTWAIQHPKDVLKTANFSREQFDHLKAFFGVYVIEDVQMEKKYRALFDSLRKETVLGKVEKTSLPGANSKTIATDLRRGDQVLPNVLVPEGFNSDLLIPGNKKTIVRQAHPELLKLDDENLDKASALELFMLIKMIHPDEHGLKVHRWSVLEEWTKRGKAIFEELGFPLAHDYPYVNQFTGYSSVETLNSILYDGSDQGDNWWSVAEHYFPVADIKRALEIIRGIKEKLELEKIDLVSPKTGKAKGANKDQYRTIEFHIGDLEESRRVIENFFADKAKSNSSDQKQDPLTNDSGVYTKESAGRNYQDISVPMPKGAKFEATIHLVLTSFGDFRYGISCSKKFGDCNGGGYMPGLTDNSYPTRQEALSSALNDIYQQLLTNIKTPDSILDNEAGKLKHLNQAKDAMIAFAEEHEIQLTENKQVKRKEQSLDIIKGLEDAYWREEDEGYPVDKIVVRDAEFSQARLRELVEKQLKKLPIETVEDIAKELAFRFEERRPLESYEKGLVTIGKKGDKRRAIVIANYVDDMIIDNDLHEENAPVSSFLVGLLFDKSETLADLPQDVQKTVLPKKKKQSQHQLNQEIEALIDKKDKTGASFDAEEKNFIRQYTGSGGLIKEGASGRGVLYEYYTPDEVVQKMWGLAIKFGYRGGSVFEPAVGTGNFLKYAPKDAIVFGFETNHYSARIAQILYPNFHIHERAFESLFFAGNIHLKDKFDHPLYSLIIGNPPYGEFTGKYAGMGEKKWTGATEYDQYFITRGLDLLKIGGLLTFVVPSSFLSYKEKSKKIKDKIASKAVLLDAYRLPMGTFDKTDIGTDIIVFKKK